MTPLVLILKPITMKTIVQFVQIPKSEALENYVEEKLSKLYTKYDWVIKTDVFFKKENDPSAKGKICTMELSLPGPKIFATSNQENYEHAAKETLNDVERQLKKRKAQMKPHLL